MAKTNLTNLWSNPECNDVSDITSSDIGTTTASISWTAGGSETDWVFAYTDIAGSDPDALISMDVSGTPWVSLSDLQPGKTYYVWIRSNCNDNGFGNWVAGFFTTSCTPVTSLNENFDIQDLGTIPNCWSKIVISTSTAAGVAYNNIASYSPENSIRFITGFDVNAKNYLISPVSPNVGTGTHRVKFKYHSTSNNTSMVFGTMTDLTDSTTFTELGIFPATATWQSASVSLPVSSAVHFAFKQLASTTMARTYLDDVVFEPLPLCPDIEAVTITDSGNQSVTLSWEAAGSETAWQYVLGTGSGNDPEAFPQFDVTGTPTTLLEDLSPATIYTVWVRSNCGSENFGSWSFPQTFTTSCEIATELVENFDTTDAGGLPICWSSLNASEIPSASVAVVNYGSNTAPNCALLYNAGDNEGNQFLISPPLSILADGSYILEFKARGYDGAESGIEILTVGTMTDPGNAGTFTEVQSFMMTDQWVYFSLVINPTTDQYIAFKHGGPIYQNIFIDDILLATPPAGPPACTLFTAMPDAICGNAPTNISWEPVDDANGYLLTVGTTSGSSNVLNALNVGNVLNYDFSAAANTTYYYKVIPYNLLSGPSLDCNEETFQTNPETCLCVSQPISTYGDGITTVLLGDAEYFMPATGTHSSHFQTVANLYMDVNNLLEIQFNIGSVLYNFYFWVDLNNDYELTDDEILYSAMPSQGADSTGTNFTIPSGLALGHRKARIIGGINLTPQDACFNLYDAETVDFIVNIADSPLATSDWTREIVRVFPNPVKDFVHLSSIENITSFTVLNLLGQKIVQQDANSKTATIALQHLATGTYIVNIQLEDGTQQVFKIIKE